RAGRYFSSPAIIPARARDRSARSCSLAAFLPPREPRGERMEVFLAASASLREGVGRPFPTSSDFDLDSATGVVSVVFLGIPNIIRLA
ncbi:MAG: hypothetical protein ABF307_09115, partial [Candidatus Nanopelagicales bacterium]